MVVDTRIYDKKAEELIQKGVSFKLRMLLRNKNLIEHNFSVIRAANEKNKYIDKKLLYVSFKNNDGITDVNIDVRKANLTSTTLDSRVFENDTIKPFLSKLLQDGYILVE